MQEKSDSNGNYEDKRQDQEADAETMELLALMKKYPNVIVTLLVRLLR